MGWAFRIHTSICWPRSVLKCSRLFHRNWGCPQLPRSVCTPGVMSELTLLDDYVFSPEHFVFSLCVCALRTVWLPNYAWNYSYSNKQKGECVFLRSTLCSKPQEYSGAEWQNFFLSFFFKPLICLLGMKLLYLTIRYSVWPNNLCVACCFDARILVERSS